jgi:plastocyanin
MKRWLSRFFVQHALLRHGVLLLGALFIGMLPLAASAAIVNVGGNSNGYAPQTLTIKLGDSVTFVNKGGVHNVVADDGSFRCARGCDGDGKGGNGNATSSNWVATVTFNKAGTVGYFCEIHGMPGQGMFGTITVQGPLPPPPPPGTDPIPALGPGLLLLLIGAIALSALLALLAVRRQRS